MKLGNRLISVTAAANSISTEQAAEVIEVWRAGHAAVIRADGSVHRSSSGSNSNTTSSGSDGDGGSSTGARVLPPLPEIVAKMPGAGGPMGLTALCKLARDLPSVQELADAKKQKAGLAGAKASTARKRQRNAESADGDDE